MSASPTPSTAIAKARRRTLVDATIEAIADHGFAGASVSRIAGRAGMSKPAVLYHVSSRDALVEEAAGEVTDAYTAGVSGVIEAAADARSGLFAFVEETLRYLWARPSHLRLLAEVAHHKPALCGGSKTRAGDVARLIEAGCASGVLAVSDPRTTAVAITGALDAILIHGLTADADAQENLIGEAVSLVDRIVTPR